MTGTRHMYFPLWSLCGHAGLLTQPDHSLHMHCLEGSCGILLIVIYSPACLETSSLFFLPVLKCLIQSNRALYFHSVLNSSLVWASFNLGKVYSFFCFDNPTKYSMFIYYFLESAKCVGS